LTLLARQRDLCADSYASLWRQEPNGIFTKGPGFDTWEMRRVELVFELHPLSPVSMGSRGLVVWLPHDLSFLKFERELHNRMRLRR
jgi:hypothetical protein